MAYVTRLRIKERKHLLKNYPTFFEFALKNKIIHLNFHNVCYLELYDKAKSTTSETTHNEDDRMAIDIGVQKIDVGTQTEFLTDITFNQYGTTTISCSTLFDANPNQSLTATTSALTESVSKTSIELPLYRVIQCRHKCSICTKKFSATNTSQEINQSIRVQYLLDHHIYIPIGSRCCFSHKIDSILKSKLIQKIKENQSYYCTIKREELMIILDEMKEELKNKDSKIDELNQNPSLNFDDKETPM